MNLLTKILLRYWSFALSVMSKTINNLATSKFPVFPNLLLHRCGVGKDVEVMDTNKSSLCDVHRWRMFEDGIWT
jgi:hypothetical protein